jgi:hypothetical protein
VRFQKNLTYKPLFYLTLFKKNLIISHPLKACVGNEILSDLRAKNFGGSCDCVGKLKSNKVTHDGGKRRY